MVTPIQAGILLPAFVKKAILWFYPHGPEAIRYDPEMPSRRIDVQGSRPFPHDKKVTQ
jgi:hypothetical protein